MKKAQVSLFVILGIVLVLSTALFFTLRRNIESQELIPTGASAQLLPSEFAAIQPFVDRCLEQTAKEAILSAGDHGGYVTTDSLRPTNVATEGNAVRMSRGSPLIIPYWFYLESKNDCEGSCKFTSIRLPLDGANSVETQIERYVDTNLNTCIQDFASFKELGFEFETKPWKTKVIIGTTDVQATLSFPFTVSRQDNKATFKAFTTRLDVPLRQVYQFAEYLTNTEKDHRYLERTALNLIVGFSGREANLLPPMADSTFTFSPGQKWFKSQVRQRLQSILTSYISALRVQKTPNYQDVITDSRLGDRMYSQLVLPNDSPIENIEVNFAFLDFWDLYFDLNCNGEICEPEEGITDILPIGAQRYNFVYDVSFPVMVELHSASAFNNEGYTFQFMLESNVRRNAPMPAVYEPIVGISDYQGTLLCDLEKRTSGAVSILAVDVTDEKPLDGVSVLYSCIESCGIGETEQGRLETALPPCLGGSLYFQKEGYVNTFEPFDAKLDQSGEVKVQLTPLKELKVDVRKRVLKLQNDQWMQSNDLPLADDENAIVILTPKNGAQTVYLDAKQGEELSGKFAEGVYDITIQLLKEKPYVIPERKYSVEDEEITEPRLEFESMTGGMASTTATFTRDDLSKGTLILTVLAPDFWSIPIEERKMTDLEILTDLEKERYQEDVRPRFE